MFPKTTGFSNPAQGYEEKQIDLNSLLIRNPVQVLSGMGRRSQRTRGKQAVFGVAAKGIGA